MTTPNSAQSSSKIPDDRPTIENQTIIQVLQSRYVFLVVELKRIWREKTNFSPKIHNSILLFLVVLFSFIPPALVMADRWFQIIPIEILEELWCKSPYFCKSMLASYFLVIFVCIGFLLVLMFFQRHQPDIIPEKILEVFEKSSISQKQMLIGWVYIILAFCGFVVIVISSLINQHYPGWSLVYTWAAFILGCLLVSVTSESIRQYWKNHGEVWTAIFLMHVSIVGLLIGIYGESNIFWATGLLFLLSALNIWRYRQKVPMIFWIVSLALIVFTINLNGWWTAAVGDEFGFHGYAWELLETKNYNDWGNLIFSAKGVNSAHPYFSSILQAISMLFFGHENFGWRFSNPYLSSIGVGLFYLFCKNFLSKHLAWIAAFLMAVSSYIMAFSKIGYNNLQALFAFNLVLAVSVWVLRSKTYLSLVCLGSVLAFCFYVYPAGLYVPPMAILLLFLYYPPNTRESKKQWLVMTLVWVGLVFPLLMQPLFWQSKVAGTFFNQPNLYLSLANLLTHSLDNLLYASLSFLYISSESHFVASSYLDPVTSGFMLTGFGYLVYRIRRQRFALFIIVSFIYLLVSVGISHDRNAPPNTRMFMFLPVYILMAVYGICWIEEKVRMVFPYPKNLIMISRAILIAVLTGLNLYQAYPLSHIRFSHTQQIESLFIRITENVYKSEPYSFKKYAVIVDKTWGIGGLLYLQKIYPHLVWAQLEEIKLDRPVLPDAALPMLRDRNTIVILMPWLNPYWVNALDEPLKALEKERCVISTSGNDQRFLLYHHPELPEACYP